MKATPPPFSATNARTFCHTLRGTSRGSTSPINKHVVLEQLVSANGQASQRGFVLLGIFWIGVLQIRGQLDRGIALQ